MITFLVWLALLFVGTALGITLAFIWFSIKIIRGFNRR